MIQGTGMEGTGNRGKKNINIKEEKRFDFQNLWNLYFFLVEINQNL